MGKLAISLLGSMQVTLDGATISSFESDKVRALLAYLAVEAQHALPRETLAELLWPEQPEGRARHNLSQALYALRNSLRERFSSEQPLFLLTAETIQLNPSNNFWLDVNEFSLLIETCERHSHAALETCHACQERLQQAAALYRGDFLQGFSLCDSAGYQEWLLIQREIYRRKIQQVLANLIASYERYENTGQALQNAQRLVALDPYDESACQSLMRLLATSGRRDEALAHYESFRSTLRSELDLAPQAETSALYQRIHQGKALETTRPARRHNLPASVSPIIGRESELAELQSCLQDSECRLLTILGPGGVGKSRLALEAGRGLLSRFADGVFLVNLSPLTSLEAILPALATALDFNIAPQKPPLVQLQDYLRQKEILLVLDGCEGLLEGVPLILDLLRNAPDLKILATSRVRLKAEGERVYRLDGLAYPNPGQPEAASYPAVRLFVSGARRVRSAFALNPQDLLAVVEICSAVQGMPLAILLAAAWVEVFSPTEILAEMRHSPDFLQSEWADLPPRQHSVRATFDYSWSLLDTDEQAAFQALCVFHDRFTHQAAAQVSAATPRQLRLLADKSFLMPQTDGRYDIHALLRQFGLEKLRQTPALSLETHRRHSAYFLGMLQGWEVDIKGANQMEALAEMDANINDLRPAWEWAAEHGDLESLAGGLEPLCLYFELRARVTEGKYLCQDTAAKLAHLPTARSLQAKLIIWESRYCRLLGDLLLARQQLDKAQGVLYEIPEPDRSAQQAQALFHLEAAEEVFSADVAAAQEHLQRSLALYRQLGDVWRIAGVLNRLGDNRHLAGDYGESDRLSGEAMELHQELGAAAGIANAQRTIVQTQFRLGNIERALALMEGVIASSQASGDRAQAALDLRTQGVLLLYHGRYEQAISLLSKALLQAQDLGDRREIAFVHLVLGMAWFMNGQYKLARGALGNSLELGRSDGFQRMVAASLWSLGCIALVESKALEAKTLFRESLVMYRQVGHQDELIWAISLEAYCLLLAGQLEQAKSYLEEALQIANSIRGYFSSLFVLAVGAMWLGVQGQSEKALEVYTLAAGQPVFAHSAWFHQVFDENILAYTKGLSGEAAQAARERGGQRQLCSTVEEMLHMTIIT